MENSSELLEPSKASWLLAQMKQELSKRQAENRLTDYRPYPKQVQFHHAPERERMLMAGNQLGKTLAAANETAMHMTGLYPDWWRGKRFDRAVRWLAGSESAELTRKGIQRLLLGPPEAESMWGTGTIPKAQLLDWSRRQGVADAVASIIVRHISGDVSSIQLATYDQGRTKWQADTVDGVWFDEEPPEDIYFEGLTRTNAVTGPVYTTLTPLLGISTVVRRFYLDKHPGTHLTQMTIEDVGHYTAEQRAAIIQSYPEYERNARTKGIPQLGSGRVFPLDENDLTVAPFPIPAHWPQIAALDFGWDHPSAAVRLAWDRDSDCLYVIACHRQKHQTPAMFTASVRPWADWLPWAWPHDGLQHDKGSGDQLAAQYRQQGLKMIGQRATFDDGTSGVEAGIAEMLDRMETGRLKVFSTLSDWWEEFRMYHRKDGLIVKLSDDLMAATRYGIMMKRFAAVQFKKAETGQRSFSGVGRTAGWMGD
jgi:phage terminase large subunit-like protein